MRKVIVFVLVALFTLNATAQKKSATKKSTKTTSTTTLPKGVVVLDNQKIKTFDDLMKHFAGKNVFVDLWGTYCGPCIAEFDYSKDLHAFLDKNNVEMLYFCIPSGFSEETWNKIVTTKNMVGNHLKASRELTDDLGTHITDFTYIPRYLIIKNGKIVNDNAKRPSSKEDLYKQIQEAIK